MDLSNAFAASAFVSAIGWALFHAIWQITALSLIAALLVRSSRQASAQFRLAILKWTGLSILVWITGTFMRTYKLLTISVQGHDGYIPVFPVVFADPSATKEGTTPWQILTEHLDLWVLVWLIGLTFPLLRLLLGLGWMYRLRKQAGTKDIPPKWIIRWRDLCKKLGFRREVSLRTAPRIKSPMLIGWWRPVVVVPLALWTRLPPQQLEALLLHELVHLAKKDQWWNGLLIALETLFYFHPGIWWLANRWRQEQENRCDDEVIAIGGQAIPYAKALYQLQKMKIADTPLALAAAGQNNDLLRRIQRIIQSPNQRPNLMEKMVITAFVALTTSLLSLFYQPGVSSRTPEQSMAIPVSHDQQQISNVEDAQRIPNLLLSQNEGSMAAIPDTLPREKIRVRSTTNGSSIDVELENGTIHYLNVDGRVVPQADYPKYRKKVEALLSSTPPTPPASPRPRLTAPPVPPAPPTPPAPPAPSAPLRLSSPSTPDSSARANQFRPFEEQLPLTEERIQQMKWPIDQNLQKLPQRQSARTAGLDAVVNVQLGQIFPDNGGIRLPYYGQLSKTIETPEFDPYDEVQNPLLIIRGQE